MLHYRKRYFFFIIIIILFFAFLYVVETGFPTPSKDASITISWSRHRSVSMRDRRACLCPLPFTHTFALLPYSRTVTIKSVKQSINNVYLYFPERIRRGSQNLQISRADILQISFAKNELESPKSCYISKTSQNRRANKRTPDGTLLHPSKNLSLPG